ncbi:hypothetical protein KY320_01720 [Candidatus Woesearchaeota archaeon]|nr:hypothetical protein [Candidatus Woesearchaeota archaeon]
MAKKKELTWDEIGEAIGKKMEQGFKDKDVCGPWNKPWMQYKEHGGGFGRLLFIIGTVLLFNHWGVLAGVPWWVLVMIVIGFAAMKF